MAVDESTFAALRLNTSEDVTLREPFTRRVFTFLLGILMTAAGVWLLGHKPFVAWIGIVFFGFCTLVLGTKLIRGDILVLRRDGFVYRQFHREHLYRWTDVRDFRVLRMRSNRFVAWDFAPDYARQSKLRQFNTATAGAEAMLPSTFGLSAQQLADVMEARRLAHGTS